jgi:hypothetical protein
MLDHTIEAGDLRVVFRWRDDRYAHAVERFVDDQWRTVLESEEGGPDGDWPASPPLQTLHIDGRAVAPVALLVGMAGASHWSASVEPLTGVHGFAFDVACRVKSRPVRLGSAYRRLGDDAILEILAGADSAIRRDTPAGDSTCSIAPTATGTSFPATVQWRYRIELTE